jgi:hypothetical protein
MAFAHAMSDKVEPAYRGGDPFEKRRRLMAEWAAFRDALFAAGYTGAPLRGRCA